MASDLAPARAGWATALGWIDPAQAFLPFAEDTGTIFFDSAATGDPRGRWSFLCIWPERLWRAGADGRVTLDDRTQSGDILALLQAELGRCSLPVQPGVPFTGGIAGFLSYEFGAQLLPVPRAAGQPLFPDVFAGLYTVVFAFDHASRSAWLFAPDPARRARALDALSRARPRNATPERLVWHSITDPDTHRRRVRRALAYIAAGDIYQANIALRAEAELPDSVMAADLFMALRGHSPAPFSAFLNLGEGAAILSASPERFLRIEADGTIETRPIKGTRPRGATPAADAALASALLASAKDRAENLMIVDLLRNDLSRVSTGVTVPEFCALESYAQVHHLVSSVRARLHPGATPFCLLRAAFPGGSITGAPKIRAMQIIAELEEAARGPYCGSAFWAGADGAMDSSILIRTVSVSGRRVIAQAGGGIVADSDPEEEWREAMTKLRPILHALGDAGPHLA